MAGPQGRSSHCPPGNLPTHTPAVGFPLPLPHRVSPNHPSCKSCPCSESAGSDDKNWHSVGIQQMLFTSMLTVTFTEADIFENSAEAPAEPPAAHHVTQEQVGPRLAVGRGRGPGPRALGHALQAEPRGSQVHCSYKVVLLCSRSYIPVLQTVRSNSGSIRNVLGSQPKFYVPCCKHPPPSPPPSPCRSPCGQPGRGAGTGSPALRAGR